MAIDPLASSVDVEAALGRSLTSEEDERVAAIIDKLSELFRRESGQLFTEGESTVRLKVNGGRVYLPQRPVVEVASVTDDDGNAVEYDRHGQWLTVPKLSHEFVTVSYSHGGDVPDIVRLAVADATRQVLLIAPAATTGVAQQATTTGPFSGQASYAAWAQGGSARLSPDDAAIARSFRVKVPTVWVSGG